MFVKRDLEVILWALDGMLLVQDSKIELEGAEDEYSTEEITILREKVEALI